MNKAINLPVYGNNAMSLRRNVLHHSLLAARLANYTLTHAAAAEWRLGLEPASALRQASELLDSLALTSTM